MSWPTPGCEKLIDAMVHAEGGDQAFVRAVRCSLPTTPDVPAARIVAANTIAHALWDFALSAGGGIDPFVRFLGARWAPVGAENDPTHLNENWVPNVLAALRHAPGSLSV